MVSERLQRRIERLLERADAAADEENWDRVAESAQMVLALDGEHQEALALLAMVREAGTTAGDVIASGTPGPARVIDGPSRTPGRDEVLSPSPPREGAIELQDEALAITRELGMRPLTERILARREILRA